MKKGFFYLVLVLIVSKIMFFTTGCANIVPPTGGPRDSLPPRLISASPKDSSLNFSENRIVFYFNEYVDVQNARENMIVSPTPKIDPIVDFKLRTVTVRLKDTLEKNTTYSINFGNAIRDINENNELKNFTYVFSTGSKLDNHRLSGKVLLAETGKIDSTLTVLLHRSGDDSAVVKERPRYIAKVDRNGNFNFKYLPAGTFYLFALKDEGGTKRYLAKSQLFAFASKPVVVSDSTISDTLYAYTEAEEEVKKNSILPPQTVKEKNNQEKRLLFQTNLEGGQQDLLSPFEIQFTTPLKTFDSTKLIFTDITYKPVPGYSLSPDSLNKKLTIANSWKPDSTYHVIIDKDFAEDSTGKKILKRDTITFKVKKESEYGSLKLRFPNLKLARNPVLQLVQSDKVVFSSPMTTNEFYVKLFKPGDYDLRILYDDNKNGKWDAGSFFGSHKQPEKVQALDQQKYNIKANWDKDYTIQL